jgi:hypothetical protein
MRHQQGKGRRIPHIAGTAVLSIVTAAHAQQPQPAPAAPPSPAAPANAAPQIEPKAIEILNAACHALAAAKTMSFTAVSTYEKAARNGQPLYYATLNEVTLQRPDKLRVITAGDGAPLEPFFTKEWRPSEIEVVH